MLTAEQMATVDRLASAKKPSPYELGALAALLRQTRDPVVQQQIEETLRRHRRQP